MPEECQPEECSVCNNEAYMFCLRCGVALCEDHIVDDFCQSCNKDRERDGDNYNEDYAEV